MSTFSLSILGVLESLGVRTPAPQAATDKEGFQSLLDISASPEDTTRREAAPQKEKRRDDLAPAFSNTASEKNYVETPVLKEDTILAPANEKHKTRDLKVKDEPENTSRPVEKTEAANDNDTVEDTETVEDANATDGAEKKKLTAALQDHLALLRDLLELLKAFGGTLGQGEQVALQVTAETATEISTQVSLSPQANGRANGLLSLTEAQDRLQALFDKLQAALTADNALASEQGKNLRALIADLRQGVQDVWIAFKQQSQETASQGETQLAGKQLAEIHQLLSRLTNIVSAKQGSGVVVEGTPDPVLSSSAQNKDTTNIIAKPATPTVPVQAESAAAQPSTPVVTTNSQQSALATPLTASATQNATPDFGGGSQQGGQSLPQALSIAREPGQPSSTQGAGNSEFAKLLAQTKTPVLEQVIFQIKTRPADGSSKILIKLEPAELGKLEIKMHVDAGGKTSLTVTADNKNTLDLLQRDARGLERALADAGLKADTGSLNFSLRGDGQDQQYPSFAHGYPKALPEENEPALDTLTRDYALQVSEGLDIRI